MWNVADASKVRIFISYAHFDFEELRPGYNVSRVERMLEDIRHDLKCGDKRATFVTWRDAEGGIRAGDDIDHRIDGAIESCDIGLILMSSSYVASEECWAELCRLIEQDKLISVVETEVAWTDAFERKLHARFPGRNFNRIKRSPFYSGILGSQKPFGYPLPELAKGDEREKYFNAMLELVEGIKSLGGEILRARKADQGKPAVELDRRTVFLAHGSPDVKPSADLLVRALEGADYSVLRFDPKLHVAPNGKMSDVIKAAIDNCDVAVQLIGGLPGLAVEGDRLVPLQYKLAKASGKPFYAWRIPDFDPSECSVDHAEFLKSVSSHGKNYEEFEQYVLKSVASVVRARSSEARRDRIRTEGNLADDDNSPLISIDVAKSDVAIANVFADALGQSAVVRALPYELDVSVLEQAVADYDGIVMIYTDSLEGQNRIGAHLPIIRKMRRRNPLFGIAIGNGVSPDTPYPRGPNVYVIKVDRDRSAVDPSSLNHFLDVLRANAMRRVQSQ
jgi:hypothetical protein